MSTDPRDIDYDPMTPTSSDSFLVRAGLRLGIPWARAIDHPKGPFPWRTSWLLREMATRLGLDDGDPDGGYADEEGLI